METKLNYNDYNLTEYENDVNCLGLKKTWDNICDFVLNNSETPFLNANNFGELYEIGLALQDKEEKKANGQYFTPPDVSLVMSEMLDELEGANICDVGCGTGSLILSYLDYIGFDRAVLLIASGHLFLYDLDETALNICKTSIAVRYGHDLINSINIINCDFLDKKTFLPEDARVISNPPYAKISVFKTEWDPNPVIWETKEFYSAFIDKIVLQAKSAVVISPFSFLSGTKFYLVRKDLCERGNGYIFSFDNVPGNIFGRKHGVFNTNHANSVRPSITSFTKSDTLKGYKISPLIRFNAEERKEVLNLKFLKNTLPDDYQIITSNDPQFKKIDKRLYSIYENWIALSDEHLSDICSKEKAPLYSLFIPNTCRYYTCGASYKLSRGGQFVLYFDDYYKFCYAFCLINSSFAYWWWRIYDGAITYPKSLLDNLPVFYDLLSKDDLAFFVQIAEEMNRENKKYIITKKNVGVQENIKYPIFYRDIINKKLLSVLHVDSCDERIFDVIHSNKAIGD